MPNVSASRDGLPLQPPDSTGSPIIWAWYKKAICGVQAQPKLLGEPNPEARFVLDYWQFEKPEIISQVFDTDQLIIVDTNNPRFITLFY